jgi:NADH-quinone oxidoreductase subunit L
MLIQEAVATVHPLAGTFARYVWLLPVLPFLGFVINGVLAVIASARVGPPDPDIGHGAEPVVAHVDDHHVVTRHRYEPIVSIVGPAVLVLSFLVAFAIFLAMRGVSMESAFVQTYYSWMPVGKLQVNAALQLDQLSMMMALVVTGVGALIHIFSVGYMRDDPSYPRYFAYLNLFVFFMLVLVLGANFPVVFVGWEGVGLCS